MGDDFPKNLSFSERLAATSKMQDANPGCATVTAVQYAKSCEESARKDALSLNEYHELIGKSTQLLPSSAPTRPVEDHHVDEHVFPNLPNTGARIGRYVDAQHHKDGLFSEVFRANLPESDRHGRAPSFVALKITVPSMMTPPHNSQREARILVAAKSEHVIQLLETFQEAGGRLVLVFPYLPYDLNMLLHRRQMTRQSRRSILHDLFSGLAHIHSRDIIHRDIKPSNILLSTPTGPAYIADFGIAWSASDAASESVNQKILDVGTTCYRPPELLFGSEAYGTKLDMWAAGCVASQVVCLDGQTLFDAGDLGSELALIKSIFETLGTPNNKVWPESAMLPDWGKMNFTQYTNKPWNEILPNAEADAADLVSKLVVYESSHRLGAESALKHSYLS